MLEARRRMTVVAISRRTRAVGFQSGSPISTPPIFTWARSPTMAGRLGRSHCRPGSLAIDAGVDPCPDEDQRSVPRQNGTPCDSGAFESDAGPDTVAPVVMTAADASVDATDANGAIATYDPATAVDDRDGPLPADCSPASGSPVRDRRHPGHLHRDRLGGQHRLWVVLGDGHLNGSDVPTDRDQGRVRAGQSLGSVRSDRLRRRLFGATNRDPRST